MTPMPEDVIAPSDVNLKQDIVLVGEKNGHKIYEFNYKYGMGLPEGRFRGVMAQQVLETHPHAVAEVDGMLAVDYDSLGLQMEKIA